MGSKLTKMSTEDDVKAWVTEYYGKILKESKDLKTNACCASGAPPKPIRKLLKNLHPEVLAKFYGCGFPFSNGLEVCSMMMQENSLSLRISSLGVHHCRSWMRGWS